MTRLVVRHGFSTLLGATILMAVCQQGLASPGDTPEYPTRFVNTKQPMDSLLRSGYRVTTMTMGIDSMGFVLEQDGKWIMCTVRNPDRPEGGQMLSQCFSMS